MERKEGIKVGVRALEFDSKWNPSHIECESGEW